MNVFEQMAQNNAQQQPQGGSPFDNMNSVGQVQTNLLGTMQSGQTTAGQRIVIAAVEKMGKTTLACNAPRALLVPLEMGFASILTPRTEMPTSFEAVQGLLGEVKAACQRGQFEPKTLVFDSGTALERLIHDAVLRRDKTYNAKNATALTMEAALGGYGKAYNFANELFANFLNDCDELAFRYGINIVITCHVFASKITDPAFGEYDSWDLLLHSPKNNKNYGKREMVTQWADMVAFLHEPLFITKGDGEALAKATSMNRGRVLGVDRTPGYVAGNRYGITGTIPIPPENGWNYLANAVWHSKGIDIFNRDVPFG